MDVAFVEPGTDALAQLDVLQPVQGGCFRSARCSAAPPSSRCGGIAAERSRHEPRGHLAVPFFNVTRRSVFVPLDANARGDDGAAHEDRTLVVR